MSGPTLFVGEGNFSFSSALCKLSPENKITATCLQRQEDVRHEGAAANIQIIRDSGMLIQMIYNSSYVEKNKNGSFTLCSVRFDVPQGELSFSG